MHGPHIPPASEVVSIGAFRLFPSQRRLTKDGETIKLGSRALDILIVLADRAGEVVSQKEIIAKVWPNVFVEDVSLRVHIAALRKTLNCDGTRYLRNARGRGYSLVAPTSRTMTEERAEFSIEPVYYLPSPLTAMVGRDEDVKEICEKLLSKKFVTVVGAGGVGKTIAALSVAHLLLEEFLGAICFVELSAIGSPQVVATTITSAFRLSIRSEDPIPELIAHLRDKRVLLILDNCEHLIETAAVIAERLVAGTPHLHILATSREALRAEGEQVHLLHPLVSPPANGALTATQVLAYPAARLFCDRVGTAGFGDALTDEDARIVGGMCRELGGIALAIELAAARVAVYGIRNTASLLSSQVALHWSGRRTAPARQQTINAMLDWSHNLLSEAERMVLRQLSTFAGSFTLEAAKRVVQSDLGTEQVVAAVGGLCEKFLVSAYSSGPIVRYRLLDITRTYAASKLLLQVDEMHALQERHAIYYRDLLAENASGDRSPRALATEIDNIRTALHWSFGPKGDPDLGVQLARASATTWLGLGLLTECYDWMKIASDALNNTRASQSEQLEIYMPLAITLLFIGREIAEFEPIWNKVFSLAVSLGDTKSQMEWSRALWARLIRVPRYAASLLAAEKCLNIARGTEAPGAVGHAEWMVGQSKLFLGRLEEAIGHFGRFIDADTEPSKLIMLKDTSYDRRLDSLGCSSCLLWLTGFPEQALRTSREAVSTAESFEFPLPFAVAMMWCGFSQYFIGSDIEKIEADMVALVEHSELHGIPQCQGFGLSILGLCQTRRGRFHEGRRIVEEGLRLQEASHYRVFHPIIRTELAEAAVREGRIADAEWFLRQNDGDDINDPEHWCTAEILRVKGVVAEASGDWNAGADLYQRAGALAHRQGALSWELRSTISFGKSSVIHRREREAVNALEVVYGRFTEGFGTPDMLKAKRLLDELRMTSSNYIVSRA
ncbi:winged helix-turn-helix domain-containing protein [Mesorhizobium sp. B1-1-8]|uniref:winged helix-turn-helix domain-containing protein n=1 Tax=Mesorhizobium sp. B1-1-8 TaxID=2589976 RepID=UPI00112E95AA|nr:winged helix-turn-helix domain-containing protein [Mesorhizobium sp. B1-1-8]UCI05179.1 helix-turn-helix transcriptional regulator [Mesorhizobium sp. B1-1-8]